ncbi:type-1 OGG1 family protein [Abortiporus biennis]
MSTARSSGFRKLRLSTVQLSLAAVLQCGQSFRWSIFPLVHATQDTSLPQYEYRLCLRDRVVCLRQTPDALLYRSAFTKAPESAEEEEQRETETLSWIRDYFQLDIDLQSLYEQWAKSDPVFHNLKDRFQGVRILRQDPFECLLSFICSSNNNITRITKMVKSLCTQFSSPLLELAPPNTNDTEDDAELEAYHPFPLPSVLASPKVVGTLRSLGFGYRAEFIQKTAEILVNAHGTVLDPNTSMEASEKWLHTLRKESTSAARAELLKLMGVGRKVADCILLMSLDKREVVPVDTHVHQIAVKYYKMPSSKVKTMTPKLYNEVNTRLAAIWGEYAGWAHSVLFTSDLKSFSTYGLTQPSTSTTPSPDSTVPSPLQSPPPSAAKRKRNCKASIVVSTSIEEEYSLAQTGSEGLGIAERVKRRKR